MGQSTNAILAWGYCWDEEGCYNLMSAEAAEEYGDSDEWWDEEIEGGSPASIAAGVHCSYSCPMPYIAVSDSHHEAIRGYAEAVSFSQVENYEEWKSLLDGFLEDKGITPPGEPGWFLCCLWGV